MSDISRFKTVKTPPSTHQSNAIPTKTPISVSAKSTFMLIKSSFPLFRKQPILLVQFSYMSNITKTGGKKSKRIIPKRHAQ